MSTSPMGRFLKVSGHFQFSLKHLRFRKDAAARAWQDPQRTLGRHALNRHREAWLWHLLEYVTNGLDAARTILDVKENEYERFNRST